MPLIKTGEHNRGPHFLWDTSHALAAFIMRPQAEAQIGADHNLISITHNVNT